MSEWIDAALEQPALENTMEEVKVLVFIRTSQSGGYQTTDWYDGVFGFGKDGVTHWMNLPEDPVRG